MESKNLNIDWVILWRIFFIAIFTWLIFLARDVIGLLLLAIVISTAFQPIVSFLERKRIPRILGTLLIYLAAFFIIGFVIYAFIPIALSEFNNLISFSSKYLGPI